MNHFDWPFFASYCGCIISVLVYSLVRDTPLLSDYVHFEIQYRLFERGYFKHSRGYK